MRYGCLVLLAMLLVDVASARVAALGIPVQGASIEKAGSAGQGGDHGVRRSRCTLHVQRADGSPWVGAKVHARSWLLSKLALGKVDVLEAVSDARGRARISVLPGRDYCVWASEIVDGKQYVSQLHTGLRGSQRATLRSRRAYPTRSIELSASSIEELGGALSWSIGPASEPRLKTQLELDADGRAAVPLVPWPIEVRLRDAKGRDRVRVRVDEPEQLPARIAIPRLPQLICKVGDFAGKEVVPLARIHQVVDGAWLVIGRSNDDGLALCRPFVEYLLEKKTFKISGKLLSRAKGWCDATKRVSSLPEAARDLDALLKQKSADLEIRCGQGRRVRGRLMWKADEPVSGMQLLLRTSIASGQNSWSHIREPFLLETDREGRFVLRGFEKSCGWRLFAMPSPADLNRLGRSPEYPWLLPLWIHAGDKPANEILGDVVIGKQTTILDVEVVSADGMPARFPRFVLGERQRHPGGGIGVYSLRISRGSRHGRSRLMLPKTDKLRLGVGAAGASAVVDLDLADYEGGQMRITLPETKTVTGVVVDQRGRAVANARVWANISSAKKAGRARTPGRIVADANFARQSIERFDLRSDEQGRFTFAVARGTQLRVGASHGKGSERRRASSTNLLVDEGVTEELRLMLPGTPKKRPPPQLDRRR